MPPTGFGRIPGAAARQTRTSGPAPMGRLTSDRHANHSPALRPRSTSNNNIVCPTIDWKSAPRVLASDRFPMENGSKHRRGDQVALESLRQKRVLLQAMSALPSTCRRPSRRPAAVKNGSHSRPRGVRLPPQADSNWTARLRPARHLSAQAPGAAPSDDALERRHWPVTGMHPFREPPRVFVQLAARRRPGS